MQRATKRGSNVKWANRQRLRFIEVMAYYAGIVTRSDVARAFGISDAAATKDLSLYNELAPGNLHYRQSVFGFVPDESFEPCFADLAPAVILPLIAANQVTWGGPFGDESIYGIGAEALPLPVRLPDRTVLAQITRAIRARSKLSAVYQSLSGRDSSDERVIEPHALVNTGLRWHVRAYNVDTYDFRDFVLSRFVAAQASGDSAESDPDFDDDWVERVTLQLAPHPGLNDKQRRSLVLDYGASEGIIELQVRRALIGYVLQGLSVDTTADCRLSPDRYHLVVANRDEIEPFAAWAFD